MSSPHSETAAPTADEFLTALEEAYHGVKRTRRSIRLADSLTSGLGLDSLDVLELLVSLEKRYGIVLIDTDEVSRAQTVADLHAAVSALVSGSAA